jgi:hypothetical protein
MKYVLLKLELVENVIWAESGYSTSSAQQMLELGYSIFQCVIKVEFNPEFVNNLYTFIYSITI